MSAHDVPDLAYGDAPDSFDSPEGRTYSGPASAATPGQAAYDPLPDIAALLRAGFDYNTIDSQFYAERVAEQLDLTDADDGTDDYRPSMVDADTVLAGLREAIAAREPQPASDPDGQQRYIDQLHDLIRDMLTTYPGLATELPTFQDRAGQLYVHDHDGQPFSGSWADGDGPLIRPQPAPGLLNSVQVRHPSREVNLITDDERDYELDSADIPSGWREDAEPQPAPGLAAAMARVRRALEDSPTASIARREALEIINAFGVER